MKKISQEGWGAVTYYKLKQQTFGEAKQFETAACYAINQKRLGELLERHKYLGGKQQTL